ncbi:hypothetical protein H4R35_004445 [Dimargaris xerosporica]|nr:hypothetical protein H4R35_004445 [Dimargaris xerosporica]
MANPFPLLVPTNTSQTRLEGMVTIKGQQYPLRLHMPEGRLDKLTLQTNHTLTTHLVPLQPLIHQRLCQCSTLDAFLYDLRNILDKIPEAPRQLPVIKPSFVNALLGNLIKVGWTSVRSIAEQLSRVVLEFQDEAKRLHAITLELPSAFPVEPPGCTIDFPEPCVLNAEKPDEWFLDALRQGQALARKYQQVWDALDELDRDLWVLEPQDKLYATLTRRLALDNMCSMEITLSVSNPRDKPLIRLYGSDNFVRPLRDRARASDASWDSCLSFHHNLEAMLGIKLPEKSVSRQSDLNAECGICYTYQLKNQPPTELCPNDKCRRPFHQQCLLEWLRADPSSRQSFNIVFGACPYCSEEISTLAVVL